MAKSVVRERIEGLFAGLVARNFDSIVKTLVRQAVRLNAFAQRQAEQAAELRARAFRADADAAAADAEAARARRVADKLNNLVK